MSDRSNQVPLSQFCGDHSQQRAAEIMDCTQSAVHQAIKAGREIYIVALADGGFEWFEIKRRKKSA